MEFAKEFTVRVKKKAKTRSKNFMKFPNNIAPH